MSAADVVFWAFACLTVGSGAIVVFSRNLIHSAFALLATFFGVAGLYLLLGADFVAATQLLVYVGGILVLLLFGVMLTHKLYDLELKTEANQVLPGAIIAAGIFVVLARLAVETEWPGEVTVPVATTATLGNLFLDQYLLPFWAASILLLVALMGAALIVRRRKDV